MAELPITQTDIDNLADKLDGVGLPPAEKALLTALIMVAAGTLGLTAQTPQTPPAPAAFADRRTEMAVETTGPVPAFREQISSAFRPGLLDEANPPAGLSGPKIGHAPTRADDPKIGPDPSTHG